VVVLEKGSEPGAHILSGAVMDPRALTELFPDWKERGAPLNQPVTGDDVLILSARRALAHARLAWCRATMHNHGNYVVSLGVVTRGWRSRPKALGRGDLSWLCRGRTALRRAGRVAGVATGNMGIGKDGQPHATTSSSAWSCRASYTIFAEGARGHLGTAAHGALRTRRRPRHSQTSRSASRSCGSLPAERRSPGRVVHTAGWPMSGDTFGGGFLYHLEDHQVTLGFVVGLDYRNPWLSPFEELQRWKTHPAIRAHIEGGKRIGYGARAINNGTPQALPKTVFPGGALVGCDAGYHERRAHQGQPRRHQVRHALRRSASTPCARAAQHDELVAYPEAFEELAARRACSRPATSSSGSRRARLDRQLMTGRRAVAAAQGRRDDPALDPAQPGCRPRRGLQPAASSARPSTTRSPTAGLTFDRLSSVFVSNTNHEEHQPAHLTLKDPRVPVRDRTWPVMPDRRAATARPACTSS
jgi:electron-transferring-flavoprotein dehydrogenase